MYPNSAVGSLVAFLVVYSFLVSLCNGACVGREPKLSRFGERPDGCMDGDIKRTLNSTWFKEECMMCTCDTYGEIDCCSRMMQPIIDDQICEAVLNKTSCTYTTKRKDNSPEPCESLGSM